MRVKSANDIIELSAERLAAQLQLFRILLRLVVFASIGSIAIDTEGCAVDVARAVGFNGRIAKYVAELGVGPKFESRNVRKDQVTPLILVFAVCLDHVRATRVLRIKVRGDAARIELGVGGGEGRGAVIGRGIASCCTAGEGIDQIII